MSKKGDVMSIVVLGDNTMTFRQALQRETTRLMVFRQKDPAQVFFELRDAEQAYVCLGMLRQPRMCDVPAPNGGGFRLSRRVGGDTLVELPMAVLTAQDNRAFFTRLFGATLLNQLVGISEPKTDQGLVRKDISIKVESEWRPAVDAVHALDRQYGRVVQTQ